MSTGLVGVELLIYYPVEFAFLATSFL